MPYVGVPLCLCSVQLQSVFWASLQHVWWVPGIEGAVIADSRFELVFVDRSHRPHDVFRFGSIGFYKGYQKWDGITVWQQQQQQKQQQK